MMAETTKILVVDDERGIRDGCRRIFEAEGFKVDVAGDGKEGLQKVQANGYDLVLVDLMMPEMGGLEMMERIGAIEPELVMIVITGFATIETAVEAMKKGAYDYVPKPFSPDQLLAIVNRGLEKRRLRLQTLQLLKEREERLLEVANEKSHIRTIVNSMADAVLVINRDQQLVLWNPAALRMLSLAAPLDVGGTIQSFLQLPALVETIEKALSPEFSQVTIFSEEIELQKPEPATLMANVSVVRNEIGEPLGVVSILRDITRLKEIERLKSQFVTMVAHELRAPLSAIEGYLVTYLSGSAGPDAQLNRQMLERSQERAHSLLELVNDLLHMARLEARAVGHQKERLDISQSLNSTIALMKPQADNRGIEWQVAIPERLPRIEADRSNIDLVFSNLLSNAIKFNVDKGKIKVEVKTEDQFVKVSISDTGIGISAEDQKRLFEEFFRVERPETRHITGTGLGLAIVKKIVQAHFGRIEVLSQLNRGTTFNLFFPIKDGKHET